MSRLLALTALFAALAIPASAAESTPAPDCHGIQVTDKSGDSTNTQTGETGNPSSDLVGGFLTYDPATGKAGANIMVDTLTAGEIDEPYTAISWEFSFSVDGKLERYVRGYQDRSGTIKWTWGEPRAVTDDQTAPRAGGPATGSLLEGKNGVVHIDIPMAEMGIKPGSTLKGLALETRQWAGSPAAVPSTPLPLYSYAPPFDDAAGKTNFTVGPCTTPAPAVTPGTPSDTTSGTGAGGSAPPALNVKVTVPRLKASKLKKGKKIAFRLSGKATGITAALRKGGAPDGKAVATGKLASLNGKGRLKLKLKSKVKKGKYLLTLAGKNPDGRSAAGSIAIRIR